VQVAVGSEGLWARFAHAFGLDVDDPRWRDNASRVSRRPELTTAIEAAFSGWEPEALLERLAAAGIPAGRVRTVDEVFDWEQTRSQGLALGLDHPTLGRIEVPGPPLRFFRPDGTETTPRAHVAPPRLGEHDADVLAWLGAVEAAAP
jgi:crotonobetainyl-CoA:carnitine CoA-transferase CaiB-like acyl-CoA transferase